MKLWLLNTGFCAASEHHLMRGAPRRATTAHALCALLEHPRGLVLFDTGYAPRVLDAFGVFPFWIYRALTPTTTRPEWGAVAQLERSGFKASDVRLVIVSHLHADHIGGLKDFPDARIVLSERALEVSRRRGFRALRHGFVPMLAPDDLEDRAQVIRDFTDAPLTPFGATHDLFGDGTVRLMPLPGHARGQIGAYIEPCRTLLAADGAWLSAAFRQNRPPDAVPLRAFFDDPAATIQTLDRLHRFHLDHPDVRIVPTHCPEFAALVPPGTARVM